MIELFWIVIGAIAIIGTPLHFWYFGHYGVWGEFASIYHVKKLPNKSAIKSDVVCFKENNIKWSQWCCCKIILSDNGLFVIHPIILNYLIPSILIPWKDIKISDIKRLYLKKYLIIKFNNCESMFALPVKYQESLEKYLTNNKVV